MKAWLLGTGGAVCSARRSNTSLAVARDAPVLVDCSANPVRALQQVGARWRALAHVLLTHHHADHLSGLPSLVHQLLLDSRPAGRGALHIWGPASALDVARALLAAVGLDGREDMFELCYRPLAAEPQKLSLGDLDVTAFPVDHAQVPTLGYRFRSQSSPEAALAYSADTEPCASVLAHSRGSRVLVHECSSFRESHLPGHTTLAQVPSIVQGTDAERLLLVHLPPVSRQQERAVAEQLFGEFGERVSLAEDLLELPL